MYTYLVYAENLLFMATGNTRAYREIVIVTTPCISKRMWPCDVGSCSSRRGLIDVDVQ